jgi:hypothetical protein
MEYEEMNNIGIEWFAVLTAVVMIFANILICSAV